MIASKSSHFDFVILEFFKVRNPNLFIPIGFFIKPHEGWDVWIEKRNSLCGMTSLIFESCCWEKFFSDVDSLTEPKDSIESINSMLVESEVNIFLSSSGIHFFQFPIVPQFNFALNNWALYQMKLLPDKIMNVFSFFLAQFLLDDDLPCWHFLTTLKRIVELWYFLSCLFAKCSSDLLLKLLVNLKVGLIGDFRNVIKRRLLGQSDNFLWFIDFIDDEVWEKVLSNCWELLPWGEELNDTNTLFFFCGEVVFHEYLILI